MEFRTTRHPDDANLLLRLHREGYRDLDWRFQSDCMTGFLAHVQATMAAADLDDRQRNRLWFAEENGSCLGCAGLLGQGTRGQLRWVVLLPEARGRGIGRKIVEQAIGHARHKGFEEIFLETTDGLEASMALYRSMGFAVHRSSKEQLWFGRGRLITMTMAIS